MNWQGFLYRVHLTAVEAAAVDAEAAVVVAADVVLVVKATTLAKATAIAKTAAVKTVVATNKKSQFQDVGKYPGIFFNKINLKLSIILTSFEQFI